MRTAFAIVAVIVALAAITVGTHRTADNLARSSVPTTASPDAWRSILPGEAR